MPGVYFTETSKGSVRLCFSTQGDGAYTVGILDPMEAEKHVHSLATTVEDGYQMSAPRMHRQLEGRFFVCRAMVQLMEIK